MSSSIPREMIEQRAAEIARQEGREGKPTEMDLSRAEDQLRTEFDPEQEERRVPDVSTPAETRQGLDPKDNPQPPPH